jgi:predicted transposase YdaD
MVSKDTLWKGIIENLVNDFMRYFFPEYVHLIDFTRPFEFLDTELQHLLPANYSKKRHADKLIKVWLLSGEEAWFLIHVEVQGYADPYFAYRMYEIFYRIRDKYQRLVTGLAIYTHWGRKHHFTEYRQNFFGSYLVYGFNTYVLRDHPIEELTNELNPFAAVMEAAWQKFLAAKDENLLSEIKLNLVKKLQARNIAPGKIDILVDFITLIVPFQNSKNRAKFEEEIIIITKSNKPMGIREAILHEVETRGIEKGEKKGRKKGRKKRH